VRWIVAWRVESGECEGRLFAKFAAGQVKEDVVKAGRLDFEVFDTDPHLCELLDPLREVFCEVVRKA